ncbi:hypothetical protein, partial [Azospirillum sp. SYSU D00513]|uniref:hypothetical protein n=1 Tax=Azospirillum sp. SYSU D00513 TaxID=2812561 RepID=UPI001A967059
MAVALSGRCGGRVAENGISPRRRHDRGFGVSLVHGRVDGCAIISTVAGERGLWIRYRDYPEFRARRGRFQFQALMAFVNRSPNMTA